MLFQKALITGATSGIGKALAELLAEKKIPLILVARDVVRLEELKNTLPVEVNIIPADLTDQKQREDLLQKLKILKPDLVINNAGMGLYGDVISQNSDEQLKLIELNCSALVEISRTAALWLLEEKKPGVIFNISSAAAYYVFPSMAVYAASKAFVNSFSLAMDFELKGSNIRVLTLCPGKVKTEFFKRATGKEYEERGVMSSEFVAGEIWKQIQSGKSIRTIDWRYRFGQAVSTFLPKRLIAAFLRQVIKKRK